MKAVFLPDHREGIEKGFNHVVVQLDAYSLKQLSQGWPLTLGFYTDNNEHLPSIYRGVFKIIIGSGDGFIESHEKIFKNRQSIEAAIDKTYLIPAANEIKEKILTMLAVELGMNIRIDPAHPPEISRDRNQYELFTIN